VANTAGARLARFAIPVTVRGSYEFEFDVTSFDGKEVYAVLPVGDRVCELVLAGWNGKWGGINFIDGKDAGGNPTKIAVNGLPKNRRFHVAIRVELETDQARITVDLDGKPFVRWQGPQTSLSQLSLTMPNSHCPGLCSVFDTRAVFHTASIRMLSGEGRLLPSASP
jgi:hypothetical protein